MYKLVILVRTDIKMSKGKIAVQVAHASVTCAIKSYLSDFKSFNAWYSEGQKKVALKVKNINELMEFKKKLDENNILNCVISDAGLTELEPGTITVLGAGPCKEEEIDKITGHLPLL